MNAAEVIALYLGAVFTVAVCLWLKNVHPELAVILSLFSATAFLVFIIKRLTPVFNFANSLMGVVNSESFSIILKIIALSFITELIADICRDCCENAVASTVELAGRAAIVITSLPLFKNALDLIVTVTK